MRTLNRIIKTITLISFGVMNPITVPISDLKERPLWLNYSEVGTKRLMEDTKHGNIGVNIRKDDSSWTITNVNWYWDGGCEYWIYSLQWQSTALVVIITMYQGSG